MKIAYLSNVRFPSERAHSVQIFHMCKAFSDNDIDLTLFVNKINSAKNSEIKDYFKNDFSFIVKRLTRGPFLPKFKPSYYIGEIIFSISFLLYKDRKRFDIVYSRNEWIVWFLSFFIPTNKLVWESHEAKFVLPAKKLLRKGVKTIVISEGIFEAYKDLCVPETQMLVAYDGMDESFFIDIKDKDIVREELGLAIDDKVVMYIGGFDKWKGVETFFQASNIVSDLQFVAIGGSDDQVLSFSKEYPKVKFLGSLPYFDLKHNQQAADVLVVPNTAGNDLSAKYTSPLKLFAHMASGVPLVVSNIPSLVSVTGVNDVITFTPDSPESLKEIIGIVFDNYTQKKQLAQELKEISKKYTWTNRASKITSFITNVD